MVSLSTQATDSSFRPYQRLSTTGAEAPLTDRFHRPQYDGVGILTLFPQPLFVDENGDGKVEPHEYRVKAGETWDMIWRAIALDNNPFVSNFELARAHVVFEGTDTFCFTGTPFCQVLSGFGFTLTNKCLSEGDYEVELLHNGVSVGKQAFRPSRFVPKIASLSFSGAAEPKIPGRPTPVPVTISTEVVDEIGCGEMLSDVTVRLSNTIAASSTQHEHTHTHFGATDVGTGDYSCSGFYVCHVTNTEKTIVEGRTSEVFGEFSAPYTSGDLGVSETVTASVRREATGRDPAVSGTNAERILDIRLPGLFRFVPAEIAATSADGQTCPGHDPLPHWLTVKSIARLSNATRLYQSATGRMLSLNDASPSFGGLYENKGSRGRSAACHQSHRVGVDIDINSVDGGQKVIRCNDVVDTDGDQKPDAPDPNCREDSYVENGRTHSLMDLIVRGFAESGGSPVPEGTSIHFRFSQ